MRNSRSGLVADVVVVVAGRSHRVFWEAVAVPLVWLQLRLIRGCYYSTLVLVVAGCVFRSRSLLISPLRITLIYILTFL